MSETGKGGKGARKMLDLDLIFGRTGQQDHDRRDACRSLGEATPIVQSDSLRPSCCDPGDDGRYDDWLEIRHDDGAVSLVHPDHLDDEVIDSSAPCAVCGGIAFWWDLTRGQHCERCQPRTTAERLRELAQRLRERYSTCEPPESDRPAVDS